MPREGGTRQPTWRVLLEDIRAQNKKIIHAVETSHRLIARLEEKMEARFTAMEQAQRATTLHRMGHRLGERVTALERRG